LEDSILSAPSADSAIQGRFFLRFHGFHKFHDSRKLMPLRIVADENIPLAKEAFSAFGVVELYAGRSISSETVRDADALIVRSITRVDETLLSGTRVRFVGTATIGTDHIDLDYLKKARIAFADAAGCNANSVAEYVAAALLDLEASLGVSFVGKTIGVVGVGNVGAKVVKVAEALGMNLLLNDPPRAQLEGPEGFVDLHRVLAEADVVTLHTPLAREGEHPTFHLLGERELDRMKPSAALLNTSRGSVVDGKALFSLLERGGLSAAVIDVWEGEPDVHPHLLERAKIATPHIAGYSFDGKLNGTRMMRDALARFLGEEEVLSDEIFRVPVKNPNLQLVSSGREALREAVFSAYPIQEDDRRMRERIQLASAERGRAFDLLRKEYPIRREFFNYRVAGQSLDSETESALKQLGFKLGRA
jgi:erythronate-4-phosphate dehydrogenase